MSAEFVLAASPIRYWWPVKVRIPDPETAGAILERSLEILFEAEDQDEAIERQELYATLRSQRDRVEHERRQLFRVCKDWKGVVDPDRRPVPFTEDNFRQALQQSWFRAGVYAAYADSLNGEAAQGN